jgi:transglutaminase superfamily protein
LSEASSPLPRRFARLAGGLAAFARRTPRQRRAILRMLPALIRIETTLRSTPVPVLAARLGVSFEEPTGPPRLGNPALSARESSEVEAATLLLERWPVDARCLRRSLLIGHALRARSPVLRIGAAKHDGSIHAHAWIEVDGLASDRIERGVEFRPLRRARRR